MNRKEEKKEPKKAARLTKLPKQEEEHEEEDEDRPLIEPRQSIKNLRRPNNRISISFIENGYLLGNIKGWSYFNLFLTVATSLFSTLVFAGICGTYSQHPHIHRVLSLVFFFPAVKCLLLFYDLYHLLSHGRYSILSLFSLISSTACWTICFLTALKHLPLYYYCVGFVDFIF